MKEEIRSLIRKGLYQQNLIKLIELCEASFDTYPALYGTLASLFRNLAEEYNDQAIPTERDDVIMRSLQAPLLALLEEEEGSAEAFLARFNDVLRALRGVAASRSPSPLGPLPSRE